MMAEANKDQFEPAEVDARYDAAKRFASTVAHSICQAFHSGSLSVEWKSDNSPVTEIDRGSEQTLRELIQAEFPDDAILGEEFDDLPGTSGYRWILDPIDGTRPFIHGVPLFGTLIGVERDMFPLVGVCATPGANDLIYHGVWRDGAYVGGVETWDRDSVMEFPRERPDVKSLSDATLCYTQLDLWDGPGESVLLKELVDHCKLVRGWGDCFGHMLVASGRVDAMIDTKMSLWDAAALQPIVAASGAAFFGMDGTNQIDAGSAISCHPSLQGELVDLIRVCRDGDQSG